MSRVPPIAVEALTPTAQRTYAEIAGTRGGAVRGPFAVWMHRPDLADKANRLGNALRLEGGLDQRLFELMVLLVARAWDAQYEWYAHEAAARSAGVSAEVVEAVRHRRRPDGLKEDEQLVYELVTELNETHGLRQETYDRALSLLGLERLIELVTAAGFYTMVAMMINAFEAPLPGGARPLP